MFGFYHNKQGSRYWHKWGVWLSEHSPGLVIGAYCASFFGAQKWPSPLYRYSVPIKRYVRINFVLIVNQTRRWSCYRHCTDIVTLVQWFQTFLVRGPLRKIWWSAKDKILNYIGFRGPVQLISRTTSGPRSRLRESLP